MISNRFIRQTLSALLFCFVSTQVVLAAAGDTQMRVARYGGERETAQNVAFSFDADDSYASVNGRRPFKRIAGLVAVALEPGVAPDQLIAAGGELQDYSLHSKTAENLTLFAAPKHIKQEELRFG